MAVSFAFYSCSDSDSDFITDTPSRTPYKCITCKSEPEAKAENDNTYKGIYIGVSPRGFVVVDIQNSNDKLTSKMKIDGTKIDLIAKNIVIEKNLYLATFFGTYNNNPVSFDFVVDGNGNNSRIISSSFPEMFTIKKETSVSMLEVYEGALYISKENSLFGFEDAKGLIINDSINDDFDPVPIDVVGRFNMIVSRSQTSQKPSWSGISVLSSRVNVHSGIIDSEQLVDPESHLNGILRVDEIRGVFVNGYNSTRLASLRML